MRIDIIATIPDAFEGFLRTGVIGRSVKDGTLDVRVHNLRDWASDDRGTIDDRPYGGGPGMVLTVEPLFAAIEANRRAGQELFVLSAIGERLDRGLAAAFAAGPDLLLVCGRYEGMDERVIEHFRPRLLSVGDYVLSGGETAAMVVIDAIGRFCRGVVGDPDSLADRGYPQYSRPEEFRGMKVPDVLRSGAHAEILAWREGKRRGP